MIVIVQACGNNFTSIENALKRLGADFVITNDIATIKQASHVILPGVGHARRAMQKINAELKMILCNLHQPVLGICLGMQLLFDYLYEGEIAGLGIIPGRVEKINASILPHMGWNKLSNKKDNHLLQNINNDDYVYFVHSYAIKNNAYSLATTLHQEELAAVVKKDNFYGVQFHPERSSRVGQQLLKNFLELN